MGDRNKIYSGDNKYYQDHNCRSGTSTHREGISLDMRLIFEHM